MWKTQKKLPAFLPAVVEPIIGLVSLCPRSVSQKQNYGKGDGNLGVIYPNTPNGSYAGHAQVHFPPFPTIVLYMLTICHGITFFYFV